MAAATVLKKQWGYFVGGDTGAASITGDIYVKRLLLNANDSADTITVTDTAGSLLVNWAAPVSLTGVFEVDAKVKGLVINPSAADDWCSVIVE